MKDWKWKWSLGSDCRRAFVKEGELVGWLVGCEELTRFLQMTYYRRLTAYGIWKKGLGSGLVKVGGGKKSAAAVRYGHNRRRTVGSRSPAGQGIVSCITLSDFILFSVFLYQ